MIHGINRNSYLGNQAAQFVDSARGNWNPGRPRVFKESLDSEEHDALKYILENLAQKSLLKLLTIQGKLKERGARLDHIHPLAFFMGIMSHSNLRDNFIQLRNKGNKAWKEFIKGAVDSFNTEKRGSNINDHHIERFCEKAGKDPHFIRHLMHTENWDEFFKHL